MDAARRIEVVYDVPEEHERWLLEEDTMPESALHDAIIRLLVDVLVAWNAREGGHAAVGRNIALRWNARAPKQGVDPDVYVVDPAPPEGEDLKSLCLWKPGHHAPRLAIEVVSERTADTDYGDKPDRYAASGTRELWIFDPLLAGSIARGGPHVLQVWRRDDRGRFLRVYAGDGPARSQELGAWVVVTDDGRHLRIADAEDSAGLWLTLAEAERSAREAERAGREAERAGREAERAGREAAEAEVARLRAELAKLGRAP